jgi:glucose-1-phosphate thymidylyltransferase
LDIRGFRANFDLPYTGRMKIIIPMAGRGSRLRPHTLTTPKPMLPIAGKPIVQRLVEDIAATYTGKIEEIAFVIGDFGPQVEADLKAVAARLGAKGTIYYQDKPLGTAHAIQCAQESLDGEVIIGFADTLFRADFVLNREMDGVIWVKSVEDPRSFGVVKVNAQGVIEDLVEKPDQFVSDLAIIGIYYVKDGARLRDEIQYLLDNDLRSKGEYQLTDALANMKDKGMRFAAGEVLEWMDCGNKDNVLETNARILDLSQAESQVSSQAKIVDSIVIQPCYIGPGTEVRQSVVGPYVSIGANSVVHNSILSDTIIQTDSQIRYANLSHAMIGSHTQVLRTPEVLNIGDYSAV